MNETAREIAISPHYRDEEKATAARATHFMSLGILLAIGIIMIGHIYSDGNLLFVPVLAIQAGFVLYAFILNRRGSSRTALYILVISLLVMVTYLMYTAGNGFHDTALLVLPGALVVAGLLFDEKFLAGYAFAAVLVVGSVVFAEVSGMLQTEMSEHTSVQDFVDAAVILATTSVFIGHITRDLRRSLERARANEHALALSNAELEQRAQDLRESEERFRATFEQAAVGIAHVDTTGRFLRVNQRWCDILKYSREELLKMTFREITHPDHFDVDVRDAERLFTGKVQNYSKEKRYIRKDATPVWVNLTVALVRDAEGRPKYSISVVEDISVRKQVEDEIWKLNEGLEMRVAERTAELQAANRELESFSYSVSHDLRAPLRHISGYLELLSSEKGTSYDEKSRRYLEMASKSAVRLGHLIDDLLAFSRVSRTEIKKTEVDVRRMVEEIRTELEGGEARGRRIEWEIRPMPAVQADPALLRQVMVNLLSNAVKFTKVRTVAHIEVGSLLEKEGDRDMTLYVRDNGAGFDMKYVEKLFGVFQRLHGSDEFEGTGIGLANVRRIVQRHGGRTWAEGRIDQGATFYVTLQRGHQGQ